MKWMLKLHRLCFRSEYSAVKIIPLLIVSVLTLQINWNLGNVGLSCETSCHDNIIEEDQSDFLSCAKTGEIITKTSVRVLGEPLTRRGIMLKYQDTNSYYICVETISVEIVNPSNKDKGVIVQAVFLTIGIPTIQRIYKNRTANYLLTTLNSLFSEQISEEELKDILIVIFLADTEKTARENVKQELLLKFDKYLKMNVIHVISAPSSFYPRLEGLPRTFGDSQGRLYWRSKQTMDYVFLLQYSHGLAEYYMQLEDDVTAEPDYMTQIRSLIAHHHNAWAVLHITSMGFIGKLFRDDQLMEIGRFLETYYNEMPCDWLLPGYKNLRGEKTSPFAPRNMFHHIGKQSSSLGT